MTARVDCVGPTASELLAELHGRIFAEGWPAAAFAALLSTPGTAAYVVSAPDPCGLALLRSAADEAEIITVGVLPAQRREGLAGGLLLAAFGDLRGVDRVFLEVAEDNVSAIALYRRLGFRDAGRRKGYYARAGGGRIDALVMSVDLPLSCRSDGLRLYTGRD